MPMAYDTNSFKLFAKDLRAQQPLLAKRLTQRLRAALKPVVTAMRAEVQHPQTGDAKNIRSSVSQANGAVIIIDGLAQTFGVGNRSGGRYKHKVFGKWSSSEKTVEPISPFIAENWDKFGLRAESETETAIDETIDALERAGS